MIVNVKEINNSNSNNNNNNNNNNKRECGKVPLQQI